MVYSCRFSVFKKFGYTSNCRTAYLSWIASFLPMTNRVSVILNEVKNRTVTKGKPTAEILHFVQNDIFFLLSFFACLMLSLRSRNDDACRRHCEERSNPEMINNYLIKC